MPLPEVDHAWSVRVRWTDERGADAYARTQSFHVGAQASLRESDPAPSAIEYLLGALGGDLAYGLQREAAARAAVIHGLELSLAGRLDNILVHLGVVGERGHAGLAAITGAVYVSSDAGEATITAAWHAALARRRCSPRCHGRPMCLSRFASWPEDKSATTEVTAANDGGHRKSL